MKNNFLLLCMIKVLIFRTAWIGAEMGYFSIAFNLLMLPFLTTSYTRNTFDIISNIL